MDGERRRHLRWLAGLSAGLGLAGVEGLCAASPVSHRATDGSSPSHPNRWAAAWNSADGHRVGLLARTSAHESPSTWLVQREVGVPTRAHGLTALPDGTLLAVARRPGDWLLRWHPDQQREPALFWNTDGTHFNGHAVLHPDGRHLLTTETDPDAEDGLGTGLIGVRDLRTLRLVARWPTLGRDPHQLLLSPEGTRLWVANGGLASRPETGRARVENIPMDASVGVFDVRSGQLLNRWTVSDPWLSLRHLAWHAPSGTLGVAMQAEHPSAEERLNRPVLAVLKPEGASPRLDLISPAATAPMAGYGGDIVATSTGFAVSSPRAGRVSLWTARGDWTGASDLPQACALSTRLQVAGADFTEVLGTAQHQMAAERLPVTPDNHWLEWRSPAPRGA